VAGIYLDTSALGRLLLGEPEAASSRATVARLTRGASANCSLWSCGAWDAGRTSRRPSSGCSTPSIVVPVTRALVERASGIDPVGVRSLDAIHLCTAVELHSTGEISAVLTYDRQLQTGCQHHQIAIEAPI
jgi:predicted nucleic acid-binding protein